VVYVNDPGTAEGSSSRDRALHRAPRREPDFVAVTAKNKAAHDQPRKLWNDWIQDPIAADALSKECHVSVRNGERDTGERRSNTVNSQLCNSLSERLFQILR
jgi:hypothetical protein